jgi:hypothetical protein
MVQEFVCRERIDFVKVTTVPKDIWKVCGEHFYVSLVWRRGFSTVVAWKLCLYGICSLLCFIGLEEWVQLS